MLNHVSPLETNSWQALKAHYDKLKKRHLTTFFDEDPERFNRFSLEAENLLLDFSKNRIDKDAFQSLLEFCREMDLGQGIESLFNGDFINETENRPALHTALRDPSREPLMVDGNNAKEAIKDVKEQMRRLVDQVQKGEWVGFTGKPIQHVVNIGIGGSHLGPQMVTTALKPYSQGNIQVHYIANVDGADATETLKKLNPETTIFIISSKSFTTLETLTNANTAKEWFLNNLNDETAIQYHFVAISANVEKATAFGIAEENVFPMWDWVGGRFSLWSAIGLPVATYIGYEQFENLLAGANAMDRHFHKNKYENNMPVILAMLSIWYNNFFGANAEAILPYDQYLAELPKYLQQLTMESNGKNRDRKGDPVSYPTQPVIFGEPGTNGQHSFFQLLHQGTQLIPCDFMAPLKSHHSQANHHEKLIANCFAQTEALMRGQSREEVVQQMKDKDYDDKTIQQLASYQVFEGNRPSNTILYDRLTPYTLGQIIALYEHKTFVQGYMWNIFSFDQWGVELGKNLANQLLPEIQKDELTNTHDNSTNGLLAYYFSKKTS